MAVKDLTHTSGVLFTDRRDFYLDPSSVKELWPVVTPFTTIVSNGRPMRNTGDPDFKMFEHRSGFVEQKITLGTISGAWASNGEAGDYATAVVTTATGLHTAVDASFKNLEIQIFASDNTTRKGVAVITAISAGAFTSGTITFKSLGNPDASNDRCAALASGDLCYVIGNAYGTGTTAGTAFSDELKVVWNSSQIYKTPVNITGTLYAAAKLRGYSNELARLRAEKSKEHKMQIERSFLWGMRPNGANLGPSSSDTFSTAHVTDADGNPIRATQGMITALLKYGTSTPTSDSQNVFALSESTYNYSQFVDHCEKAFQYVPASGQKVMVVGGKLLSYFNKADAEGGFAKKSGFTIQLQNMEKSGLGFNFRRLTTPHGEIIMVWAPVLRGPWAKYGVLIDPENLEVVQYRPSQFQANIKTDDAYDGVKDQYFDDMGLGITLIETHSLWYLTN